MWHKNKRRPRTVPWGTPESTDVASEDVPSKITCICLLIRICICCIVVFSRDRVT